MVTRKPVPSGAKIPPYPTSPTADSLPQPQEPQSSRRSHPSSDDETEEQNAWNSERHNATASGLPSHESSDGFRKSQEDLPEALRAGNAQYTPRSSSEMQRPMNTSNPYLKNQTTGEDSSAKAWGTSAEPTQTRPPIPTTRVIPPTPEFSKMSLNETSTNPWQPAIDSEPLPTHHEAPDFEREDSGAEAWASVPPPSRPPPTKPQDEAPVLVDLDSEDESPAWDEEEVEPQISELPATEVPHIEDTHEEENAWEDAESQRRKHEATIEAEKAAQAEQMRSAEGWGSGSSGMQPQESGIVGNDGTAIVTDIEPALPARPDTDDDGPPLPPRPSQDDPPLQPPRPFTVDANRSDSSLSSQAKQKRKETYEIRKINWHDATTSLNPRVSPILVQNVNGPCPLLALVNALVLSTPAELKTPLVEALRTREQISLLLLLDAVIDELMSGRRGGEDQELPDVIDLHYFLLDLHTGMNVNPRFFPKPPKETKNDPRRSMTHVHPSEREDFIPGTFEETRETLLYNTFSIPLIHGWIPSKDSPAYAALQRSAPSYEEVQNLQFREEELEGKLETEGLSFEEQGILEDISIIKAFLNESATQLTSYGIETIQKSLTPGSFAILFRNNHFSTLYRHPQTLQLFSLVTDMGYATHDEVVWESLADTNGENSELFSGDFRVVGGAPSSPRASVSSSTGWTTVQSRRQNQGSTSFIPQRTSSSIDAAVSTPQPPLSPNTEQEDHDLALALQMQDEEDRIAAEEQARRRREQELSQQYIEQQGNTSPRAQNIPVSSLSARGRGRGNTNNSSRPAASTGIDPLRPAIPPRRSGPGAQQANGPANDADIPPPSYEQAAGQPAYNPPSGSPIHPSANAIGGIGGRRRTESYNANQAAFSTGQTSRPLVDQIGNGRGGRRRESTQGLSAEQQKQREKDCIVM